MKNKLETANANKVHLQATHANSQPKLAKALNLADALSLFENFNLII